MLGLFRGRRRQPQGTTPRDLVAALYDAAGAGDNDRRWAKAISDSAVSANTESVRRIIRNRARYEVANNPYASGIVTTYTDEVVGTGPQIQAPDLGDGDLERAIEDEWREWTHQVHFPEMLRVLMRSRVVDGEVFLRFQSDETADIELIECDRVTAPLNGTAYGLDNDGIRYDQRGRPLSYQVLRHHPGDIWSPTFEHDTEAASRIVHLFRCERPGQRRGISELASSLNLLLSVRAYGMAVLAAAETAADFAVLLTQQAEGVGFDDTRGDQEAPLEQFQIDPRTMTTLPPGMNAVQIDPKQPTTNHVDYMHHMVAQAARPLEMPRGLALGDHSNYNYSSGQLDDRRWIARVAAERQTLEIRVLRPVFRRCMTVAAEAGRLPADIDDRGIRPSWLWPVRASSDPTKDATATATAMATGQTSFSREARRRNLDPERLRDEIIADSRAFLQALGYVPFGPSWQLNASPAEQPAGDDA